MDGLMDTYWGICSQRFHVRVMAFKGLKLANRDNAPPKNVSVFS